MQAAQQLASRSFALALLWTVPSLQSFAAYPRFAAEQPDAHLLLIRKIVIPAIDMSSPMPIRIESVGYAEGS